MQNFKPDLNDPVEITFSQLIEKINNNNESLRSNFSGESEPENFCVGQLFYNTSNQKLFLKTASGVGTILFEGNFTTDMISETETRIFITPAEKTKLAGIAENANNYTHPETHLANMINETETQIFFTPAEKTKLTGIAENANNYTHPETHSANMINETETKVFVTPAQKSKIDILDDSGDGTKFLSDDGTYQEVSGSGSTLSTETLKKLFIL